MKANWSYDSGRSKKAGVPLFQKGLLAWLAMVLMLASMPAPDAFAAPGQQDAARIMELEQEWKNKVLMVQTQNLFYEQVRLYPVDFRKTSDLDRAWDTLHQYGAWLRRANSIVAAHEGFDWAGNVQNEEQAEKSVKQLAEALRAMRGLMAKLDEAGVKFHRIRQISGRRP